jgi:hypothetical protein
MERPKIKDKAVLAYVEHLEAIADGFNMDGIKYRSYRAMIKTIEDINTLLVSEHLMKDPDTGEERKVTLVSWETMVDKDDKFIDRVKVLLKELPDWINKSEGLLESITKEVVKVEESRYKHKFQDLLTGDS